MVHLERGQHYDYDRDIAQATAIIGAIRKHLEEERCNHRLTRNCRGWAEIEMKTTDLVRKSIVISGRAAIRAAVDAGENLKYQYYDLMNDRTSINDCVSLEEQCEILKLTKSAVRNLWTRVRKWESNETLVPYSVIQDVDIKGEMIRTWMTYNIANPKEYQRFVIARKERSIAGMRELDRLNLIKTKLDKETEITSRGENEKNETENKWR